MSTEQMRSEFEEWFRFHCDDGDGESLLVRANGGGNYINPKADLTWIAWQASRAALVLTLPTEHELRQEVCSECAGNALDMVEKRLRAAGITVKEG